LPESRVWWAGHRDRTGADFHGDRLLRSVLFGVSPVDALTLASAVLMLAAVSGAATFAPALRAARIVPLEAIRTE